jgi:hypothetical protein
MDARQPQRAVFGDVLDARVAGPASCRHHASRALRESGYALARSERRAGRRGRRNVPPNPEFPARTRVLSREDKPGGRLFAGIEVGGILVSDDEGESWSPANEGLTDPDLHQILPSKKHPGLVVAACGEGVSRSTDRGSHWQKVTPTGGRTYGNALAEDEDGNLYLGITQDRPRTWTRAGRARSAIFKSCDGADWELLSENMQGGVMDMCAAPNGKGVLVATADGEVVEIEPSGRARTLIDGLPCITAIALGA